jgi:hypothetical protein
MVEGEFILLGTETRCERCALALLAVSTFKVASWGPIALKGVPRGVADGHRCARCRADHAVGGSAIQARHL